MPKPVRPSKAQCLEMGMTCALHNLRRATRAVTQRYDAAFESLGIKGTQFTILAAVNHAGMPTVTELAATLVLEQSTLSRNLSVLRRRGLLRLAEGKDRRERRIELMPAGREMLAHGYTHWLEVQRDFERAFDDGKFSDSLRFLRKITRVAQAMAD